MSEESKRRDRSSAFIAVGLVVALFGSILVYNAWWAPRYAHSEVDSIREIDTAQGALLLASESVGRSNSKVICRRSTLIDPATLERVARATASDADRFLGQDKSNVLWFSEAGQGSDYTRFNGRDPATLDKVVDSVDLVRKYPAELGTGVHEYKFNWKQGAVQLLANNNHSYLVAGPAFVPARFEPPNTRDDSSSESNTPTPELAPSLELINPEWLDVRDAKSGHLIKLASPPGGLVYSRASLLPQADVILTRTDASGAALWSRSFPRQRSIGKVYRYDDRLLVVSHGERGDGNDWLTALDAAQGKTLKQYQF